MTNLAWMALALASLVIVPSACSSSSDSSASAGGRSGTGATAATGGSGPTSGTGGTPAGSGGAPAGSGGSGASAATGGAGGTGAIGGSGGGGCISGAACKTNGFDGLCTSGVCGLCTDLTDDAACASAYGSGHLCVGGVCIAAQCHTASDCAGLRCIDNQCVPCQADTDCDATQVCSVSGACTDAATACTGKTPGDACSTGDLCCSVSGVLTCVAVACCSNAQCAANETCQAGACVPTTSGCVAPTVPTYYVDPTYTGVSTGTTTCPFKKLHTAFNAVRTDAFTGDSDVIIKGGTIDATTEGGAQFFPMTVPSSVFVRTIGTAAADAIIIAPPNTTAFEAPFGAQAAATANYSARISHLTIKQATLGTLGTAVHVTGGTLAKPIHLDHLTIRNFLNGVNVVAGGNAVLDFGVDVESCNTGLHVHGGRVDMVVGLNTDARSHYDSNTDGIWVTGDAASIVNITGAEDTTTGLKTITASNNTSHGIFLASPNANNAIRNVGVIGNGYDGVNMYEGTKVVLRHLRIKNNGGSGVRILPIFLGVVAGIDLGSDADQGLNEFGNNSDADLCRWDTSNDFVLAAGNIWETTDCSLAAGGTIPLHAKCGGAGAGIGNESPALIPAIVSHCSVQ